MKTRLDLFTALPIGASVAEIGVMAGDFLKQIHNARPDLLYTGVDNWRGRFEQHFPYVLAYAGNHHNVRIYPMASVEAARELAGERFDLVYIDANHTEREVTTDLKAWAPLVKPGGILAGHDYETKPPEAGWEAIEVKQAVDRWASLYGYKVNVIQEPAPSWWVQL